jgi:nitrogen fixation protein FixH
MNLKRNPWPYAIILYFVVFIGGMAAWITFAVRNDHELVRKDYYEQDLNFQNELDGVARAAAAGVNVSYHASQQVVTISIPFGAASGRVKFYRPSNAHLDQDLPLVLQNGAQTLDVRSLEAGLWRLRLSWTSNGAEYQHDQTLVITTRKLSAL